MNTNVHPNSMFITRFAVDDRGRLGSFYDIHRDCVLGQVDMKNSQIQSEVRNSFTCEIKKCDSKEKINLLKMLDIEKDLQLSLLLNLSTTTNRISSMMNYNNVVHRTTHILKFQHLNDEQFLSDINQIPLPLIELTATHLITRLTWGFYAILIVRLPDKDEIIDSYDSIFEKLCKTLVFNDDDKDLLKQIIVEKIYSNVYDLTTLTDLFTIYQHIHQLKNSTARYPMTYTLQPLSTLCKDNGEQIPTFMSPSSPFTTILINQISEIVPTTENIEHLLINYSDREQFYDIYQQWLDLKKKLTSEIERISKCLIDARSDQLNLIELKTILADVELKNFVKILLDFEKKLNNKQELHNIPKKISNVSIVRKILPSIEQEIETTILLLGETGVGKSTFINALVNYLTYESLETAETNQPIILIPISFIMTAGEQFQEYTISFDSTFQSYDENFNLFGQSVTQHCRSYVLQLKNNSRKKIRLIDTPGFGDTRGPAQDDRNMQHILEYVNNLTHINAICYLLKPNSSSLHSFFRSSITQLLDQLGSCADKNIIFCFTNTRATFFTPGDTALVLKTTLSSISNATIQFQKENTFCFDSESFRYLAAIQRSVPIESTDKHEYEQSWIASVKESNRLFNYIFNNLSAYKTNIEQQSMKNIQFEIIHMIRPICETIRNILRNIILRMLITDSKSKYSIKLHSKSLCRLATQCQSCNPIPIQCGPFWILPDMGHEIQNKCLTCLCTSDQHSPMEYILEYEYVEDEIDIHAFNNMIESLFIASIEFAYFLIEVVQYVKDDLFHQNLNRLINEENNIIEKVQPSSYNLQLRDQLKNIRNDYENRMQERKQQEWNGDLSLIKQHIKNVNNCPIVAEQIAVIKESQQRLMHIFEYRR